MAKPPGAGQDSDHPPGLGRVLIEDLRGGDLRRTLRRDLRDLYRFYLDETDRVELAARGRVRRFLGLTWRLLRALLLRLSPARRLLLLASLLMALLANIRFTMGAAVVGVDLRAWGYLALLVVLMLELRDKLLARDEIEVARKVQRALLPKEPPRLAGWSFWLYTRPANDVGGDLVDHQFLGEDTVAVSLGDVAGKGLGAALLMAKLQATLRALAPETGELGALGSRLGAILHRDGLDNRYATLFHARLAADRGTIRYLNAGHNPAYAIRGGSLEPLPASATPLGMLPDTDYAEGRVELAPGEMLVVYSDGLVEATTLAGEEFGEARLQEILSGFSAGTPADLGQTVLAEAERFTQGEPPRDDLSLMILRREPAG
jgi:phosphoserine phosphatase RsbU/P